MLDLVTQAGAGLSVLHELGIVHRDVKPQNLLLRSGGSGGDRVLVADLGVAKAMLHASGLTQVVGTPAYMAPEQVHGAGIDRRADVHALGAVAYQLLTGQQARTTSMSELLHAGLPPAPSTVADVSPAVDAALLRALEPDPDRRWPDVGSFVGALREALDGPDPAAGSATLLTSRTLLGDPVVPEPQRRPVLTPLFVLLLVVVLGAAFAVSYAATNALA